MSRKRVINSRETGIRKHAIVSCPNMRCQSKYRCGQLRAQFKSCFGQQCCSSFHCSGLQFHLAKIFCSKWPSNYFVKIVFIQLHEIELMAILIWLAFAGKTCELYKAHGACFYDSHCNWIGSLFIFRHQRHAHQKAQTEKCTQLHLLNYLNTSQTEGSTLSIVAAMPLNVAYFKYPNYSNFFLNRINVWWQNKYKLLPTTLCWRNVLKPLYIWFVYMLRSFLELILLTVGNSLHSVETK